MLARTYASMCDLPVAITRCANLYGGGGLNWNRVVSGTMRSVTYGEQPIIRSDGALVCDYLLVQDAITGYLRLAEVLDDLALEGLVFNVGAGNPQSALQIVQAIIAISDYPEVKSIILNEASNTVWARYVQRKRRAFSGMGTSTPVKRA